MNDDKHYTWDFPDDLNEAAWGLIANAWNGNWDYAPTYWKQTAIRWRDAYHKTLERPIELRQQQQPPRPSPAPGSTDPGILARRLLAPPPSVPDPSTPTASPGGGCLNEEV